MTTHAHNWCAETTAVDQPLAHLRCACGARATRRKRGGPSALVLLDHGTAPVRDPIDDDDRGLHHDPVILGALEGERMCCSLCADDATRLHAEVCALGLRDDGTPRYPGFRVYRVCREIIVCWKWSCERDHFRPFVAPQGAMAA